MLALSVATVLIDGTASVPVAYKGSVPDSFRVGHHLFPKGRLESGTFVGVADSLVARCPCRGAARPARS